MSLILEALRKSEAQRRRSTVPDVHAELPPAPAPRSRLDASRIAWIALAALALPALWVARLAFAPAEPASVAVPVAAIVAVQPPSPRPVPHLLPPDPPARTQPDMAPTDRPPTTSRSSPAVRVDDATTDAARGPARDIAVATPASPPVSPPPAMASPAATQSLSDLSVDERKALPTLKMSMHLWNDDPSQRLVIIDGNRLHEGDRIGDAVVTAIVSDGVLLDWNGRRLKLPIR